MSQCCCLSPQEERLQGTKKVNRQGRERVYKILDRIQFTVPHVDIERARYFTESMRQTEGELLTLRWAKALKNVAEKITVYITPDQLLAGRVGQLGRYGILYPEIDGDFYIEVMKDLPNREKSPFQIDPTDMQILMEEIAPYWEGKTYHEHLNKVLPAEIRGVTYHDERGLKSKFVVSETSSYRSALQGVEIHAIFDDHRRQPRLFDRITFSMRNCNPLADTGRALFFSRINLLAECLDIRQLSARRHQLYRLVQCLRFAGGCRIQRYTSRIQ